MIKIIKGFSIFFIVLVGITLFALSNQIAGVRAFIVSSASMEPTISTGALVITQTILPKNLDNNDIITFVRPDKTRNFITHRIINLTRDGRLTQIKTKGDNNDIEDSWTLAGGSVVGKVIVSIPYLGYLLSFGQTKLGVLFFILLPATYIIIDEVSSIFTMIKNYKKKNISGAEE